MSVTPGLGAGENSITRSERKLLMSSLEGIQISREGLGHALADNTLAVPTNQRSYAWEDSHVQELFQDLAGAMAQGGSSREYFMGSIVATRKGSRHPEIVDG